MSDSSSFFNALANTAKDVGRYKKEKKTYDNSSEGRAHEYWRANTNLPSPDTVDKLTKKMDPYTVSKFLDQLDYNVRAQKAKVLGDFEHENPNSMGDKPDMPTTPSYDAHNVKDVVRKKQFTPLDRLIDDTKNRGGDVSDALFSELQGRTQRFGEALFDEDNNFGFKPRESATGAKIREDHAKNVFGHIKGAPKETEKDVLKRIEAAVADRNAKNKFKETLGVDMDDFFGDMSGGLVPTKRLLDARREQELSFIEKQTGLKADRSITDAEDRHGEAMKRLTEEYQRTYGNEDVFPNLFKDDAGNFHLAPFTKRIEGKDENGKPKEVYYKVDLPNDKGEEVLTGAGEYYRNIQEKADVQNVESSVSKKYDKYRSYLDSDDEEKVSKAKKWFGAYVSSKMEDGSKVGGKGWHWQQDSENYDIDFLKKIKKEEILSSALRTKKGSQKSAKVLNVMMEPFDRTLSVAANMAEEWSQMDDDHQKKGQGTKIPFTNLELEDLGLSSFDDVIKNPGKLSDVLGGAKRGLLNVNDEESGWNQFVYGNDSLSFKDVLRHNAERNPDKTLGDNRTFQAVAGFGADMVLDPLNFVGAAVKPLSAVGKSAKTENILSDAGRQAVDRLGEQGIPRSVLDDLDHKFDDLDPEGDLLTSKDLLQILDGEVPRRFASESERKIAGKAVPRKQAVLTRINEYLTNSMDNPQTRASHAEISRIRKDLDDVAKRGASLEEAARVTQVANAVKEQKRALAAQKAAETHADEFNRSLKDAINKGLEPELADAIHINIKDKRFKEALQAHGRAAAKYDDGIPFSKSVGPMLKDHPALKDVDLDRIADNIHGELIKQDPKYAARYSREQQAVVDNAVKKAKAEFEVNTSPAAAQRLKNAEKVRSQFYDGRRAAQVEGIKNSLKNTVSRVNKGERTDVLDPSRQTLLETLRARAEALRMPSLDIRHHVGDDGEAATVGPRLNPVSGLRTVGTSSRAENLKAHDSFVELDLDDLTDDNIDEFLNHENFGMDRETFLDKLLGGDIQQVLKSTGENVRHGDKVVTRGAIEEGAIAKALRKNAAPAGDLTPWEKLPVPESIQQGLTTPEGMEALRRSFVFDSKSQRWYFSGEKFGGADAIEMEWGRQVAAEATARSISKISKVRANSTKLRDARRVKEVKYTDLHKRITQALNSSKATRQQKYAADMLDKTHVGFHPQSGRPVPAIKVGDEEVLWASWSKTLRENFAKAGIKKIPQKYVDQSAKLDGAVRSLLSMSRLKGTRKEFDAEFDKVIPAGGNEFGNFVRQLADAGFPVPSSREAMKTYLFEAKNTAPVGEKTVLQDLDASHLQPEHLMFNDKFRYETKQRITADKRNKRTYGLSVSEAMKNEHFFLNTNSSGLAVADGGPWTQIAPQGMTKAEFFRRATESEDMFEKIMFKSPFRPKITKAKGDEALSDAQVFHNLLRTDPNAAMKILENTWKTKLKSRGQRAEQERRRKGGSAEQNLQASKAADEVDEVTDFHALDEDYEKARQESMDEALALGTQGETQLTGEFNLFAQPGVRSPADYAAEAKRTQAAVRDEFRKREEFIKSSGKSKEDIAAELSGLRQQYADLEVKLKDAEIKARLARDAHVDLLHEEAVRKVINRAVAAQKGIEIRLGKKFFIPFPEGNETLRKAAYAKNGDVMLEQFEKSKRRMLQKNFMDRAGNMSPDAEVWMHRATNNTPQIIRYHLDRLKRTVGKVSSDDRAHAYKQIQERGFDVNRASEAERAVFNEFNDFVKYFNGEVTVGIGEGAKSLTTWDIMRYLPQEFALNDAGKKFVSGARNPQHIIRAFNDPDFLSEKAKQVRVKKKTDVEDPIHLLWKTRVAVENALARKLVTETIKENWGMAVPVLRKNATQVELDALTGIRELKTKKGWTTVPRLKTGGPFEPDYIFPQEVAREVTRMLDMLEPKNIELVSNLVDNVLGQFNLKWAERVGKADDEAMSAGDMAQTGVDKFMRGFDKTTGAWKTAATIYNPGYYARNLVGEVMTAWIGGVNNPMWYAKARKILKHMNGEHLDEALYSHEPWAQHSKMRNTNPSKDVVVRWSDGTKLDVEDINVLYHDQGLKTGFINTQHDAELGIGDAPTGKAAAVGNSPLGKVHQRVREMGEHAEDLPRLAHFMHALQHAPRHLKTVDARAQYAAAEVRKYHFDYSDVSRAEQAILGRLFPFFKWTRKAIPMIIQSAFMKPGKISAYPKASDAISEGFTDRELTDEDNGIMPNYTGIVPGWIRDMQAVNVGTDEEGRDTFFNLQVPQMDALKGMSNPEGLVSTMLNPLLKIPTEQVLGHTLASNEEMQMPVDSVQGFMTQVLRTTPQGNFADKSIKRKDSPWTEPGAIMDETLLSFLSGIGFYENRAQVTNYDVERNPVEQNYDLTRPTVVD